MPELSSKGVQLDKPGAGLPFPENVIAPLILWTFCHRHTPASAQKHFEKEARSIEKLYLEFPADQRSTPVLIDRIRGIEDSSRNWSPDMVLEHLVIVNQGILGLIDNLINTRSSPATDIAAVKPRGKSGTQVLEDFQRVVRHYRELLELHPDLHSEARHLHPWFWKLNARQWHCLAATHHSIHRRQLQKMLEKSNNSRL